jgi:predicted nucleotidyltransferase
VRSGSKAIPVAGGMQHDMVEWLDRV